MRMRGLEPPRACAHTDLNRARLPIPPHPRGIQVSAGTISLLKRGLVLLCGLAALALAGPAAAGAPRTEVVVSLDAPPLAQATSESRVLTKAARTHRLDLRTPTSVGYLRSLAAAQRTLQGRIESALPAATVRWHYSIVLDALAVELPSSQVPRLAKLPGVARVYPSVRYHSLGGAAQTLNQTPALIGATAIWGPEPHDRGQRDEDRDHRRRRQPDPSLPLAQRLRHAGRLPEGQHELHDQQGDRRARVRTRVARSTRTPTCPFDPSSPSTRRTSPGSPPATTGRSRSGGLSVSGIAPKAYLGNYKVLTIPTISGVGLDGNVPRSPRGSRPPSPTGWT